MDRAGTWTLLGDMLIASHLLVPDDLAALVAEHAASLGATDAVLYLVEYDQRFLVPVPSPGEPDREPLAVDTTVGGRAFRNLDIQRIRLDGGGERVWVPVVDSTERLGVLLLEFPDGDGDGADDDVVRPFASLVAELVTSKNAYGDLFELVRRRRAMSLAAELAWHLLPPLTFGTERVVISGALVPTYEVGGDSFDYAVDAHTARIAVFDAMGHGLEAGLLASVAVAAYRNSRRRRYDLPTTVEAVDRAVHEQFGPERFVTAVLAELDNASRRFSWSLAGHPMPLLLRDGRLVKVLDGDTGLPLGLGGARTVAEEDFEPGDQLLLFTDGLVEARAADGEFFGVERLVDLVRRASSSGSPPPETMRRLIHAILDHQVGELQDDATAVLVEWSGQGAEKLQV